MGECIMALGTFDGVHRGHQAVIRAAVTVAQQLNIHAAVFTFADHPQSKLTGKRVGLLCTLAQRIELLRQAGAQAVAVEEFEAVQELSPSAFVGLLVEKYHVRGLVCGADFRFGKNGAGDSECLAKLCAERGLSFQKVQFEWDDEAQKISSRSIRSAVAAGEMERAARDLGRPFCVQGTVVHGKGLARKWGTPTINLRLPTELVAPRYGVYETRVTVDGNVYKGVTNVGVRPTFDDGDNPNVETFILEGTFDQISAAKVEFVRFIRPETAFADEKSLQIQIEQDIRSVLS